MTVALFLQLCQILAALGSAGVAAETIKKDIAQRGLKPTDPLPPEHEATVRALLSTWDEDHAGE